MSFWPGVEGISICPPRVTFLKWSAPVNNVLACIFKGLEGYRGYVNKCICVSF
jgi:hypothetical protein